MKRLYVSANLIVRHRLSYEEALDKALAELCAGRALSRRDKRTKKKLKLVVWVKSGLVNGVGTRYLNAVKILNDKFRLLIADASTLTVVSKSLKKFQRRLERRYPSQKRNGKTINSQQMLEYEKALGVVSEIFNYDKFGAGEKLVVKTDPHSGMYFEWEVCGTWSAWHYLKGLEVEACAYCNADGVYALLQNHALPGTTDMAVRHADTKRSPFDHFYSHSKYPCLGLSLHNLVPSCTRCNTNFKGATELSANRYIHPFECDFDGAARFVALFGTYVGLQLVRENDAEVIVSPKSRGMMSRLERRAQSTARFFHLEDVYNQTYRREMVDVIRRVKMIPQSYYEELSANYPHVDRLVLDRMLLGASNDANKINQERLSKLTCDLYGQLHVDECEVAIFKGKEGCFGQYGHWPYNCL